MIEPLLADEPFLADVRKVRGEPGLHVWWLGQSGFLLHHEGRFALLDPYLSDSLTKKYSNTDKPHVRMTRRVVDPAKLNFVHVVTSSHNHTDHLDAETIKPLLAGNPKLRLVVPEANRDFVAQRLGVAPNVPEGVEDGMSVKVAGFEFHGVAAAHEERELDDLGRDRFLGYVVKAGPYSVYHSGDTVGQASFLREDFAAARLAWEAAAGQGDARAQYGLGVLHWRGLGVAADRKAAARWFARAARQGYGPALSALAGLAAELQGDEGPRRSGYAI